VKGEPVFSAGVIGQSRALGVFDSDPAIAATEAVRRFFMVYSHELQTVDDKALSLRSIREKLESFGKCIAHNICIDFHSPLWQIFPVRGFLDIAKTLYCVDRTSVFISIAQASRD
jgi:hypothetical protein